MEHHHMIPSYQEFQTELSPKQVETLRRQLLHWLPEQEVFCLLDSQGNEQDPYSAYDLLLGVGAWNSLEASAGENAFERLEQFRAQYPDQFLFGHLGYDLKNEVERLHSQHHDAIGFPDLYFFLPRHWFALKNGRLKVASTDFDPQHLLEIVMEKRRRPQPTNGKAPRLKASMSREAYLGKVEKIRAHIAKGDIYEMNFCQEFAAERAEIDPFQAYERLRSVARTPFGAFYRLGSRYLLCASPERFLRKQGAKITSQPIKGTMRRGKTEVEDIALRQALLHSPKNRAENVMIVDLVRNDLSKTCQTGSVKVEELCEVYSFANVHQMISTVQGTLKPGQGPVEAIRQAFPMGSMTGAPKLRSMELIEQYENRRRGLYSGALGYFAPGGDFDFNVVIRSLFFEAQTRYLALQVGGAIVFDSSPQEEYEECLLKAETMRRALASLATEKRRSETFA
jgi:para-aminobenzoate synthetase component I